MPRPVFRRLEPTVHTTAPADQTQLVTQLRWSAVPIAPRAERMSSKTQAQLPQSPYCPAEAAMAELKKSSYPEVRHIQCELRRDELRLFGEVPTYFHKQVAQQSVYKWRGSKAQIVNHVTVRPAK